MITRNTYPIFSYMFNAEVVLGYKCCKNDWMNMKFRSMLSKTIENLLKLFKLFKN